MKSDTKWTNDDRSAMEDFANRMRQMHAKLTRMARIPDPLGVPAHFQRQLNRIGARAAVVVAFILWEKSENAVFIWKAYSVCREHEIPLPWWVTTYLDACAKEIISIEAEGWTRGEDPARKVYQALDFAKAGKADAFSRAKLSECKLNVAARVHTLRHEKRTGRGEGGVIGAINQVADEIDKKPSTVRDYYYELKNILDEYPTSIIFQTEPPK